MTNLKLGKLPAKVDARTIKLSQILKVKLLPDLPDQFNVDHSLGGIYDETISSTINTEIVLSLCKLIIYSALRSLSRRKILPLLIKR